MKNTIITFMFLSLSFISKAQIVDLGINVGNIDEVSLGLSTWKWLFIGCSFQDYNFYTGNRNAIGSLRSYRFGSPTLFLQPTIKINNKINVYAAYHFGYYIDNYVGGFNNKDYVLSAGVNININHNININGEVGYLHSNPLPVFTAEQINGYESNRQYISFGVHFIFNNKEKKKKNNDHIEK